MASARELQERQEQALFDNKLSQQYLLDGKAEQLAAYLETQEQRLQSGMSSEEIDAVTKRAERAYASQKKKF